MTSTTTSPSTGRAFWIAQWERPFVWIICALFLITSTAFSLGPILEAPDEPGHYRFTRTLVLTRALPDPVAHPNIQDHQPPLYYMILIPASLALDGFGEFPKLPRQNPFWGYELGAEGNDNKNLRLHTEEEEFPYTKSHAALVFHILRLHSVLMGLATVILSYLCFRILWPDNPAHRLLALGVIALWPQFVWLSGMVNNDNALILTSTASLYLTLRQLRDGPSWRSAILHGLVLGAALLTKASAVFLAFPVGLAVILDRRSWRYAPVTLALALAIGGWWYARNIVLTHSLAGWPPPDDRGLIRPGQLALDVAIERLPFAYQGFWARFGNVSVAVSDAIYRFFDVFSIVSAVGFVVWMVRAAIAKRRSEAATPEITPMAVTVMFAFAAFAGLMFNAATLYTGNQGRYALPGLTGWGTMFAAGIMALVAERWRQRASLSVVSTFAVVLVVSVAGYFFPAFEPRPAAVDPASPATFRFGEAAELIGPTDLQITASPGQTITIVVSWRSIKPTTDNLIAYVHTIDSDAVRRDSYPATGNLLSVEWKPGQTWSEYYLVTIPTEKIAPGTYPLLVGLYDAETKENIEPIDAAGHPSTAIIGSITITPP